MAEIEVLKNQIVERTPEYVVLRASNNDQTFTIDAAQYDRVRQHRWCCNGTTGYIQTAIARETTYLHHFVLDLKPPRGQVVDHIDGDKTNNREANLQVIPHRLNTQRRHNLNRNNTTGYRGVYKASQTTYRAIIGFNGQLYQYNGFATPEAAARKYNEEVLRLHGNQAILNAV